MKESKNIQENVVYYRLIALWILCEAMLGGVIHAAKIPVSGLVVGSCAVVCICLIAFYFSAKGGIIKATIIVAIFKMMLSPQAPPLAYLAVFFQGLMGELFFWNKKFFRLSCLLLGIIALIESGLQRIIVLTIIYGNNFWKAINDFINELTDQKNFTNYSLIIAIGYLFLHIIAGFIIGWWAGMIPQKVLLWNEQEKNTIEKENAKDLVQPKRKKNKWFKKGIFFIWIILIILYCQSYFKIGKPVLPADVPLQIFIRSVIIVLAWYFVIGPLISYLLNEWLKKKQMRSKEEIRMIAKLLPDIQKLIAMSWTNAKRKKGFRRIILFAKIILANILKTDA